jgi:molecular chaperone HscB
MSTEAISAKTSDMTACWSCGAATNSAHFCAACGKIQPLARDTDYFAFFGLPRRLQIDPEELEQRFHQLSWKLHPDNFVRASERERELALARSSQLNDAFRALRDPISRVEYLLSKAGMRREGQHKQQAPPELLEEVFELNESLDELRAARQNGNGSSDGDGKGDGDGDGGGAAETSAVRRKLEAARLNFEEKLNEVDSELEQLFAEWDNSDADGGAARGATLPDSALQRKLMGRMNDVLNRRSYIRNLVASVQKELAEA